MGLMSSKTHPDEDVRSSIISMKEDCIISIQKDKKVQEWYLLYSEHFKNKTPRTKHWYHATIRKNIPIGWCRRCGEHLDVHHLLWCPNQECGIKDPFDISRFTL